MHRLTLTLLVAATAIATTVPLQAQRARTSPHETISTVIGDRRTGNRITLTYGRPYSKDPRSEAIRPIWGELVPWGKAYRLGADEATLFVTQQPIVIDGTTIPAGAYTLYMVPSENGTSQLAFSTNLGKWGIPVDESHDLARVDLEKASVPEQVDQLTLAVEGTSPTNGVLNITWENTQYSVAFTVQS
jgi:hypothetical protein